MKNGKRLFALAMLLVLFVGFFPITAHAEEGENLTLTAVQEKVTRSYEHSSILSTEEWEMLRQINKARAAAGLQPVVAFEALQAVSDIRAKDLSTSFSGTRPDGSTVTTILEEQGLSFEDSGEYIIKGGTYISDVVAYMKTSENGKSVLYGDWAYIGIGYNSSNNSWEMLAATSPDFFLSGMMIVPGDATRGAASIDDLGLYAVVESYLFGECYLPILSEYCEGYVPYKAGDQMIWLSMLGFECVMCVGNGTGLMEYDGEYYYVENGEVIYDHTGLAQSKSTGTWYYMKNGKIAWSYTGLAKSESTGTWYYVKAGRIAWNYTGLAQSKDTGTWYYVKAGRIAWSFSGLAQSKDTGTWYYVKNGRIAWSYTGLAQSKDTGTWYYVKAGRIAWNYNGIAQSPTSSTLYYVKSGRIAWNYSGDVVVDGVTYTVVKGVVQE